MFNTANVHGDGARGGGRHNYLLFLLAILLSPYKIEALDDMFTHRTEPNV